MPPAASLDALDAHMKVHSYVVGVRPTSADIELLKCAATPSSAHPHALRWQKHVLALSRRCTQHWPRAAVPSALLVAEPPLSTPAMRPINALTAKQAKQRSRELSQMMSMLLRHQAVEKNIAIDRDGGWVELRDVLAYVNAQEGDDALVGGFAATAEEIRAVVAASDKQRFGLRVQGASEQIRANQGHSIEGVCVGFEAVGSDRLRYAVHGTYPDAWKAIATEGLSRMGRTHIHLARDLPGESGVISGMRSSCEVLVWVDVARAEAHGLTFGQSENGVILTVGPIPPSCFAKVVMRRTGEVLLYRGAAV